jgi:hypothetical protein
MEHEWKNNVRTTEDERRMEPKTGFIYTGKERLIKRQNFVN